MTRPIVAPIRGACEHYTDADGTCGATTELRRFSYGIRCPVHGGSSTKRTPKHTSGSGRDPYTVPTWVSRRKKYGKATTDPLGRTGWNSNANLPTRADGDPGPADAPWRHENVTRDTPRDVTGDMPVTTPDVT